MSGLDTDSLISEIMELEQRPVLSLQKKEAAYQAQISGLGNLKSALSGLQAAAGTLKEADDFLSHTANSSNEETLTVSASEDVVPGTYQIEVTQLAQAQQLRSNAFSASDATVGTGTLNLQVGSGDNTEITIDEENNTLAGIAAAINEADAGVIAGVVDDGADHAYLTLLSQETGTDHTVHLTIEDDDGNNEDAAGLSSLYSDPATHDLTQTQEALNARLTINGIQVERSGNTIEDLVDGLTLNLQQEDPGNPLMVEVAQSHSDAVGKVQGFVDQYNSLIDILDKLQSYDAETGKAGLLLGDTTTSMIRSRLRSFLSFQVEGVAEEVNGLSRLGIEVDRQGKLSVNSDTLTASLEENLEDVVQFFTRNEDGGEGLAVRLYNTLEGYVKSTGVLASKEDGLQTSIEDIHDQVERINMRLERREENLRSQFQALESLLAEYQTTENMLNQQINHLNNLSQAIANK